MKRSVSLILSLALILSFLPASFAASDEALEAAQALYELGLFSGTGTYPDGTPNFDLDRTPTRAEAVTMLVRLLGKDEEAKAGNWETPFTDVDDWAKPYVGYAYANGLTSGTSETTFGGTQTIDTSQYLTFVLRALGYTSGTDFQWDKAWEKSDEIGLTNGQYNASTTNFVRGDVAFISNKALSAIPKGSNKELQEAIKNEITISDESILSIENLQGVWQFEDPRITYADAVCYGELVFSGNTFTQARYTGSRTTGQLSAEGGSGFIRYRIGTFAIEEDKIIFTTEKQDLSDVKDSTTIKNVISNTFNNFSQSCFVSNFTKDSFNLKNDTGEVSALKKVSLANRTTLVRTLLDNALKTQTESSKPDNSNTSNTNPSVKFSLELPATPQLIGYYDYRNQVRSAVQITEITYDFELRSNGNVTLHLYFTGEKTFDKNGDSQSDSCKIGWKLYDAEGYVIETGTHYTSSLKVGEKFRNSKENIYDLQPGTYKLEIISVN